MIEFLRFGSQIPGAYHGCCAYDIIQGFSCAPDAKASIQVTDGDSGMPYTKDGKLVFLGPTNLDVFKQRLRIGTFYHKEIQNHAFLAVLTHDQITAPYNQNSRKWLPILKEYGFEFIRAVKNSVYSYGRPPVYLFGLFRNIGQGAIEDPFTPPKEWTDLPDAKSQQDVWDKDGLVLLSEDEVRAAGASVMLAGLKPGSQSIPRTLALGTETAPEDGLPIEDDEDEDIYIEY